MPLSMICLGLCLVYGIFGGFISAPRPLSVETLLFEATMPSLAEELAFRGIGLALLERSFHADAMSGRLRFGRAGQPSDFRHRDDASINGMTAAARPVARLR
jgi:hypothetical protein